MLLVQAYNHSGLWGFSKGKIGPYETSENCAIREVKEEIGYDISHGINKNLKLFQRQKQRVLELFYIFDVPLETSFKPKMPKEIRYVTTCVFINSLLTLFTLRQIQWFEIESLPRWQHDQNSLRRLGISWNLFGVARC